MIAFRKSPLESGVITCRGCFRPLPLKDFEPRKDSVYGIRRRCRACRRPQHERSERKRAEQRYAALESRIATVPEGPEFDNLARNVLQWKQLRYLRALACRLKAGNYEIDAEGRPIIPPALKPWADRLDFRQAESFCRRKLGLPRLPVEERQFRDKSRAAAKQIIEWFEAARRRPSPLKHLRRADPIDDDGPWSDDDLLPDNDWLDVDDSPATEDVKSRTGHRWTIEDERRSKAELEREARFEEPRDEDQEREGAGRTFEDLYIERLMSVPPPAPLPPEPEPSPRRPPLSEGAVGNNPFPPWLPKS